MFVSVCIYVLGARGRAGGWGLGTVVSGGERGQHVLPPFLLAPLDVQLILGLQTLLTGSVCM